MTAQSSVGMRDRPYAASSLRLVAILLCLLTAGAFFLRLPRLDNRPFHGDEAVHAVKFNDLWQKGEYRYDANEFHGPTIYYAALPSVWLHHRHAFADTREADYRLPIVVLGAMLVLLLVLLADGLGRQSVLWAGLLAALSPAFVFYSRYYIQEMPLAFFTLGALGCGWRYVCTRRTGWVSGFAVCAGLMIASKETAVLTFAAWGLAFASTVFWTRRVDNLRLDLRWLWNIKLAALVVIVTLGTACLFLTGFLSNLSGPIDYLRSYTPWLHRAGGTDLHRHGFFYYLQLLLWNRAPHKPIWSEGLIIALALVGIVFALLPRSKNSEDLTQRRQGLEGSVSLARFLTFYTLTLTGLYSLIPYKTPWCVLSFLEGMILLAGIGAATLVRLVPGRTGKGIVVLLLLASCAQLGWQAYTVSYVDYTDDHNPYVYAQPVPDAVNLGLRVEQLARSSPQHEQMIVKVFSTDEYYWPLPWYLRRFPNVGYYTGRVPPDADAPVILASPQFDEELTKKLDATHLMNGYFGLRPGTFFEVWIRMDLWARYLKDKKRNEKQAGDADDERK